MNKYKLILSLLVIFMLIGLWSLMRPLSISEQMEEQWSMRIKSYELVEQYQDELTGYDRYPYVSYVIVNQTKEFLLKNFMGTIETKPFSYQAFLQFHSPYRGNKPYEYHEKIKSFINGTITVIDKTQPYGNYVDYLVILEKEGQSMLIWLHNTRTNEYKK